MLTTYETIDSMSHSEKIGFIKTCKDAIANIERFDVAYARNNFIIHAYNGQFKFMIDGCGTNLLQQFCDYAIKITPQSTEITPIETGYNMHNAIPRPQAKPKKPTYMHTVKDKFREYFGYEHMTDAECNFVFVKRNVRNRIPSDKFIWAVSLECKGMDFWKAVNDILDALQKMKNQTT